jgi:hypothetical protein
VFPLPKRFRAALPRDVVELSRLLTAGRGDRQEGYLGRPEFLSAYLRYFLPWNLYRLTRLLPALSLDLAGGDLIIDLGSGPLTMVLALWLSRPGLRDMPLEFRCIDRTGAVLEAGKKLFFALAGPDSPWRIKTIRAGLGEGLRFSGAALVSALNVFNESYWSIPEAHREAFRQGAEKNARLLVSLAAKTGAILVAEPGVPRSGEFIAALRAALITLGYPPRSPCPHAGVCPLPGGVLPGSPSRTARPSGAKGKWCHFAFDTEDAPAELLRLSAAAGLPKDRVTLSFLLAGPSGAVGAALPAGGPLSVGEAGFPAAGEPLAVRIVSDPFPLTGAPPGRGGKAGTGEKAGTGGHYGRYGCSARGLVLVTGGRGAIGGQESGTLLRLTPEEPERRDSKSGALILELKSIR